MSELATPLIVGIGNPYRCDDGVGPWVADALAVRGFDTHVQAGDGTGLIDLFTQADSIILVDATRSGTRPGTIVQIDATVASLQADMFHYSTHRFGLAEAVETARALHQLPKELVVYGIEGACFDAGEGLSVCVKEAAMDLVQRCHAYWA